MSTFDEDLSKALGRKIERPPVRTYELIWRSGHIERITACQVIWPMDRSGFAEMFSGMTTTRTREPDQRLMLHNYIDDSWTMVLCADVHDILSLRLVQDVPAETTDPS